jgi:hypothetical protein
LISIKFKPRGSWFLYKCKETKINQNLVCVWSTSLTNAGEAEGFCPSHRSDCQAVCWSFQHHSIHADTLPICLTLKHIYLLAMLIVELRPLHCITTRSKKTSSSETWRGRPQNYKSSCIYHAKWVLRPWTNENLQVIMLTKRSISCSTRMNRSPFAQLFVDG